jgi:MYXO-CTERM domain-containing protein
MSFSGFTDIHGLEFLAMELSLSRPTFPTDSDALPADIAGLPWSGGNLSLGYLDGGRNNNVQAGVSFSPPEAIPEPTAALLGGLGLLPLLRRRK